MKSIKLMVTVALSAMTLVATAAPTAVAKITVTSESGQGSDQLILVEDPDCSSAIETATGKDIIKVIETSENSYRLYLYAESQSTKLSAIGTNDLKDIPLVFMSNKLEQNYTMSFSNVLGTIKLYDTAENKEVTLANGGSYAFTAAVNSTIEDRFIINRSVLTPKVCFEYETLKISAYNGWTLTVTEKGQASPTITKNIDSDYVEQSLADKNAGYYVVKLSKSGETDIEYIISVKPAVTTVTP